MGRNSGFYQGRQGEQTSRTHRHAKGQQDTAETDIYLHFGGAKSGEQVAEHGQKDARGNSGRHRGKKTEQEKLEEEYSQGSGTGSTKTDKGGEFGHAVI